MAGVEGLAMLFYTPNTYPGQGVAQEGRPGLVGTLTYAPRACPVVALTANLHVLTGDKLCP